MARRGEQGQEDKGYLIVSLSAQERTLSSLYSVRGAG